MRLNGRWRLWRRGGTINQESRLYDADSGVTQGMRSKEHAHDYRYFPEPDLVPLRVSEHWLGEVKERLPELPADRRDRFASAYGLREYDAQVLSLTRATGDYFESGGEGERRRPHDSELGGGRFDGAVECGGEGD